jgi:hypothetical protein
MVKSPVSVGFMPNFQANQKISIPHDNPISYPHMENHHDMMIKSHVFDVFISFISQFDGQNPVIMTFSPSKIMRPLMGFFPVSRHPMVFAIQNSPIIPIPSREI